MALVLPVFLAILSGCIDASRYVYISGQIVNDTAQAARLAALPENQATDCPSLAAAELSGGGFTISQDPNSLVNDTSNGQTASGSITAGTGYVYIYPAVAASTATCTGNARHGVGTPPSVTVTTTFKFRTVTPYMNRFLGNMIITATSTQITGY